MKKYIFKTALLVSAMALASSCSSELDQQQHGVTDVSAFYQTDEDFNQATTQAYATYFTTYGLQYHFKTLLSDEAWSGGGGHSDGMYTLADLIYNSGDSNIESFYTKLYNTVYSCNQEINNCKEESDIQKQYTAECKVLRALTYFDLVTFWGTPPLILETITTGQPNSESPSVIWDQIEKDLSEAISSGKLTHRTLGDANGAYRVTHEFAQALLGKVYVFRGKYAEAQPLLQAVIDSNRYGLVDIADYENLCTGLGQGNKESIFELNHYHDASNPTIHNDGGFDLSNFLGVLQGWRTSDQIDVTGYNTATSAGLHTASWGRFNPRNAIAKKFDELGDVKRKRATMISTSELYDNGARIKDGQALTDVDGWYDWKYRALSSYFNNLFYSSNNFRIMRLAEVYLLAAEAYIQGGSPAKGADLINKIRQRAGVTKVATGTMDELKTEKQLELYMECCRFQDLQRWGDLHEALKYKENGYPIMHDMKADPETTDASKIEWVATSSTKVTDKVDLLPFPQTEIDSNSGCIQQTAWQ